MHHTPPAIVLLSGGLDSAVTLAFARQTGAPCIALSFRYGQRHAVEIDAAVRVAAQLGAAEHVVVDVDLARFGGSALTADIDVPKHRDISRPANPTARPGADNDEASKSASGVEHARTSANVHAHAPSPVPTDIPITYVPARNTIFLALALALAEVRGADAIYIGVNAVDYSGYPDCRPDFLAAFERLAAVATRAGVEGHPLRVVAPLLHDRKVDIVRRAAALGVDVSLTRSCYDPEPTGRACGACDSCLIRQAAFAEAGLADGAP